MRCDPAADGAWGSSGANELINVEAPRARSLVALMGLGKLEWPLHQATTLTKPPVRGHRDASCGSLCLYSAIHLTC